jgi:threonine dehydrogenase-like Zn-dependent dehydrogenase
MMPRATRSMSAGVVPAGLAALRPGGHYVLTGMVHPESYLGLTGEALIRGCVTMRGIHNYAPRHLDQAMAFIANSSLPWSTLVSPPMRLDQLDEAFSLAASQRWARVAIVS